MVKKLELFVGAIVGVAFILTPLTASALSPVGATLQLSPPVQTFNLQPGTTQTVVSNIKNISPDNLQVQVSFEDFEPGTDGAPKLLLSGRKNVKHGLSTWLTGSEPFTIDAGQTFTHTATLNVPANAPSQTNYGTIRFRPVQAGDTVKASVGAVLLANIGTPVIKGSVGDFNASDKKVTDDGRTLTATLNMTIKNDGSHMFDPKLRVDIIDENNKTVASLNPAKTGNVLPASTRVYSFDIERNIDPKKTYKAVAYGELPDGTKLSGSVADVRLYKPAAAANDANGGQGKDGSSAVSSAIPIVAAAVLLGLLILALSVFARHKKQGANTPPENFQQSSPSPVVTPSPTVTGEKSDKPTEK